MPTFTKLKSGSWRVQVRRKNEYAANTFVRWRDAEEWALDVERSIDRGTPIRRARPFEQPRIRHEGTSRLFEAGFSIHQLAAIKDWRMLRRYTNLEPEDLHKMQKAEQPSVEQFLATLATG